MRTCLDCLHFNVCQARRRITCWAESVVGNRPDIQPGDHEVMEALQDASYRSAAAACRAYLDWAMVREKVEGEVSR